MGAGGKPQLEPSLLSCSPRLAATACYATPSGATGSPVRALKEANKMCYQLCTNSDETVVGAPGEVCRAPHLTRAQATQPGPTPTAALRCGLRLGDRHGR